MEHSERTLRLARKAGVLRPRDLERHGIARACLQRLVTKGLLRKVGRGLYVAADAGQSLHSNLAAVSRRAPDSVVCLLSALRVHGLTTQSPFEAWIAVGTGSRAPRIEGIPLRVVRMAQGPLSAGVETHTIDGVRVRVFDLEKTVVDCFRYRGRVGLDVAIEAMREYLRRPRRKVARLLHYAEVDRVVRTIRPYLEAIA